MININHQVIYYDKKIAMGIGCNLLTFGARQLLTTEIYKYRNNLENLFSNIGKNIFLIGHLTLNGLTDAIKITIMFENYFKTILMLDAFCVHKLDKSVFKSLSKEQTSRPVRLSDILHIKTWEENLSIKEVNLRKYIKGISKQTIGMKELLSPNYQKVIKLDSELLEICKQFNIYRNNLHLYEGETLNSKLINVNTIRLICNFYNSHIVKLQNELVSILEMDEGKKLKILNNYDLIRNFD